MSLYADVINALIQERELLGYQLAAAKGLMSPSELEAILKQKFVPPTEDPNLLEKVRQLVGIVPNLDADLVSAIFRCPVNQAVEALATLASSAASEIPQTPEERIQELENERKDVLDALGYYPAHLKRYSLPRLAKSRYWQLCRANKLKYEMASIADEIVKALRLPDYDGAKVKPYFDRLHRENSQMRDELNTLRARDASLSRQQLQFRATVAIRKSQLLVKTIRKVLAADSPPALEEALEELRDDIDMLYWD